jgi:hypothetical protein
MTGYDPLQELTLTRALSEMTSVVKRDRRGVRGRRPEKRRPGNRSLIGIAPCPAQAQKKLLRVIGQSLQRKLPG